jgi:hypothetical protein
VPALGEGSLDELDRALAGISERPQAWPRLGTVRRRAVRRFVLRRFPVDVVDIRTSSRVLVVAIAHHHRRPAYWTGRLPGGAPDARRAPGALALAALPRRSDLAPHPSRA